MEETKVPPIVEDQDLSSVVQGLRAELAEKTALADQYFDRLARLQADFENYRRRVRQEREELAAFGAEGLIKKLLPVLDNLDRAIKAEPGAGAQAWRQGVEMTFKQFQDVLAGEGVETISAEGLPFNPTEHEAVMQVESDEHEDNTVVEELQKGYRLAGRVIRPAMVKVSRRL